MVAMSREGWRGHSDGRATESFRVVPRLLRLAYLCGKGVARAAQSQMAIRLQGSRRLSVPALGPQQSPAPGSHVAAVPVGRVLRNDRSQTTRRSEITVCRLGRSAPVTEALRALI